MKKRKFIIIFLAAIGFLMLSLGSYNVAEENIIVEDPIEIEDWMTKPFITE